MTDLPSDARGADRSAAIVLGCLLLASLLVAGGVIGGAWLYLSSRPPTPPRSSPTPTQQPDVVAPTSRPTAASTRSGVSRGALGPASRADWGRYLDTTGEEPRWRLPPEIDRTRVDPQVLFAPARRLAQLLEQGAELSNAFPFSTHTPVRSGTVDLSKEGYLLFKFTFDYVDPTKAPGEDHVAGAITVRGEYGGLRAYRSVQAGPRNAALPDPSCPATKAWQTAVDSGVPEGSVASLLYYDAAPFGINAAVWSFRVEGHPELRREVDAQTCALVKSWAKG